MKIMFNHYKHLTEVVFPTLALHYKWVTWGEKDIQLILCNHIGIKPPVHPSRRLTHPKDMRRLVRLCYDVLDDPTIFNQLAS